MASSSKQKTKRMTKYCCIFCEKPISRADLWVVEAYPRERSTVMAGESKKMCTDCCREFFHLLRKGIKQKLANQAEEQVEELTDETKYPAETVAQGHLLQEKSEVRHGNSGTDRLRLQGGRL